MNERIKEIRKELGLNQTDFGARLGVTNPAISKLEKGERNLTDQMALAICREFNVNEDWLRHGKEPMFIGNELQQILNNPKLDELDKAIIKSYASLNDKHKGAIKDLVVNITNSIKNNEQSATNEPDYGLHFCFMCSCRKYPKSP